MVVGCESGELYGPYWPGIVAGCEKDPYGGYVGVGAPGCEGGMEGVPQGEGG